ncbi:unnamed protein product [Prorocentrum cordatum]|uniref:RRM domain-containing protein n=1 Tax=Prorocentrum cordatum TaxID=2364126 RepID=A0ABN9TM78_9DINO|nr:unnamed protein product [Polarella glacialis]
MAPDRKTMGDMWGHAHMGAALQAKKPHVVCQVVDQPDFARTCLDQSTSGEFSRRSHAQEKASFTCATMAIVNIPYTYPESRLRHDIDLLGVPYTDFHYPGDRKNKGRNRGFAFVEFATSEAAHMFQQLFHNRVLADPGSPAKNVSVVPSESSTTNFGKLHLGNHADCRSAVSEPDLWPLQRLGAPPGILYHRWHAPKEHSGGIVDPRASPPRLPLYEDGTMVLDRFSV